MTGIKTSMNLAVNPPVLPMLAKRVGELPPGEGWIFEPKWDGFRTLVFRDGDDVFIQSRDEKPLNRYFPELIDPLKAQLPKRCVLDGEIVIATSEGLQFDTLQMRLHPAESRVRKLAVEIPASVVFFDLLCEGDESLCDTPFAQRRARLEAVLKKAKPPVHLTPATQDRTIAADWFRRFEGAGLDGVIAKAQAGTYQPNKRTMLKVKHERDCDCVVAGFRWHKEGRNERVGSLLLGLYDDGGRLHHVGVTSSFTMTRRKELVKELEPLRERALDAHPWREWATFDGAGATRMPGGQSRWSAGKDLSWEPLRIERVCEVKYDHMQGDRFRHAAVFQRWRPDKPPADCRYDQLEVTPAYELEKVFGAGGHRP